MMIKLAKILKEVSSKKAPITTPLFNSKPEPKFKKGELQYDQAEADPILEKYIKIMHKAMSLALSAAKKSGYTGISKLFIDNPGPLHGNGRYVKANHNGEWKKFPPVYPGNSPIMFTETYLVGINITKFGQLELRGLNLMKKHIPGKQTKISQTIKRTDTLEKLEKELKAWVPKFVSDAKAYTKILETPPEDKMNASDQVKRMYARMD
tara:strand:- start:59 stop:682 length:624 start_codon:yes stop_codon:yes gene_type:complete